jgi:hypothetical protein
LSHVRTTRELLRILDRAPPVPQPSSTAGWNSVILRNDQYDKQLAYQELKERATDTLSDLYEDIRLDHYECCEADQVRYTDDDGYQYYLYLSPKEDIGSLSIRNREGVHLWHKSWRAPGPELTMIGKIIQAVYSAAVTQENPVN